MEMVMCLVLLAALIAGVNSDAESENGAISSTSICITTFQVVYSFNEGELPYPICSSKCRGGEEIEYDGVAFKRLDELEEFNLMVELTYKSGQLHSCRMVPYMTIAESTSRQEEVERGRNSSSLDMEDYQGSTPVPSVTEIIPGAFSEVSNPLEGFTRLGDSYYMLTQDKVTWHEAVQYCKQFEANLVVFESSYEQALLKGVLTDNVWIGLNDILTEHIFVNRDNTPLTFSSFFSWSSGEPKNAYGNEDCVSLSKLTNGWTAVPCDSREFGLCERPVLDDEVNYDRYTCPNGYLKYKSSCYIMSRNPITYAEGEDFCSRHSAYPVFINSLEENKFLGGNVRGWAFVGLTDQKVEGHFVSKLFGPPLFIRWNAGEPNNVRGIEDCVGLTNLEGFPWNDASCSEQWTFVCEKAAQITH